MQTDNPNDKQHMLTINTNYKINTDDQFGGASTEPMPTEKLFLKEDTSIRDLDISTIVMDSQVVLRFDANVTLNGHDVSGQIIHNPHGEIMEIRWEDGRLEFHAVEVLGDFV